MWKQLFELVNQVVTLTRDVKEMKEALRAVKQERREDRQEINVLSDKVDRLTELVQRMSFELQRQRDKAESDRKMLLLEVENTVLRSGRGLPPGIDVGTTGPPEAE